MSGCETCERDGKADCPVHGDTVELAKPVVIDGFCRAGGAGRGDALDLIPSLYGALVASGRRVALVHTSPPCEANIAITAGNRARQGRGMSPAEAERQLNDMFRRWVLDLESEPYPVITIPKGQKANG